jgi:WD40 repeat protein
MRDPKSLDIYQLSEKKIGGFSLHPRLPHLVATASLDRTLKIWDLRKVTGRGDKRAPALLGEHQSSLSVSCALWNEHGGLATTSYDNTIKIYDFSGAGSWAPGQEVGEEGMEPVVEVPHNNQTGRWVTMLVPTKKTLCHASTGRAFTDITNLP